jgi:hypothetical protein
MELTIPTKLHEIPLYQMVEYNSLGEMSASDKTMKALSIFLNVSEKELAKFPLAVVNKAISHVQNILNETPDFHKQFTHKGIKYGFIPNLDDITTGEFIDIENYQKNPADMWKLLSVLYRPITKEGQGHRYLIETYKGNVNEQLKDVPSDVAYGALVFFCNLGIDLLTYTLKSLKAETEAQTNKDLVKNGGGSLSSISYAGAMLQSLKELVSCPFTPLSYGVLTNPIWRIWKDKLSTKQENE